MLHEGWGTRCKRPWQAKCSTRTFRSSSISLQPTSDTTNSWKAHSRLTTSRYVQPPRCTRDILCQPRHRLCRSSPSATLRRSHCSALTACSLPWLGTHAVPQSPGTHARIPTRGGRCFRCVGLQHTQPPRPPPPRPPHAPLCILVIVLLTLFNLVEKHSEQPIHVIFLLSHPWAPHGEFGTGTLVTTNLSGTTLHWARER
jgi:hypothetical protein